MAKITTFNESYNETARETDYKALNMMKYFFIIFFTLYFVFGIYFSYIENETTCNHNNEHTNFSSCEYCEEATP